MGEAPAAPVPSAARRWAWATVLLTAGALGTVAVLAPHAGAAAIGAARGAGGTPAGPSAPAPLAVLTLLLFVGSSVHVASTGSLFGLADVRSHARIHSSRYLLAPLGLIAGGATLAALVPAGSLDWLLLGFFGWQFFHFQKQNLGIVALSASAFRCGRLRPAERRLLTASGWFAIAGLVAHPRLLQLDVLPSSDVLFDLAAAGLVTTTLAGARLLLRRSPPDRPAALVCLFLLALAFPLPIFLFSSPYAAVGGMTVAHGLQYLLLVGLVTTGADGPARRRSHGLTRLAALANGALLLGLILDVASHLHSSSEAGVRAIFGAYLGFVAAHFVIDAGLWRLRDQFPRALLARQVPYLVRPAGELAQAPAGAPEAVSVSATSQPSLDEPVCVPVADRSSGDIR